MDQPDGPRVARNPYDVLGVSPNASIEEIRDAYWRLIRFYRTEGDPSSPWTAAHLEEIQEAYERLGDPVRRAGLDAEGGGAAATAASALEEPDRPVDIPATAAVADRDRLDRHRRGRDRDRARDQGLGREPLPDSVLVNGADAALRRRARL